MRSVEAVRSLQAVPTGAKEMLRSAPRHETSSAASSSAIVRLAAEKSQLMDDGACAADASAAPAARVMAVQLCGERKVSASRSLLKRLADDPNENAVVRKSAAFAFPKCGSR